jgi:1-acyl-sn-glycerol-3-phosphate acyltransferase
LETCIGSSRPVFAFPDFHHHHGGVDHHLGLRLLPGRAAAVQPALLGTSRWNVFMIWCLKVICGIRYEIKGYENLPDAPAVVLSKHQSAWETIFLLPNMPRPLVFVFKKEILYIPFFGWAMALLRMIPIDRKQGKHAFKHVVRHGKRRLADGQWIIMFPEGTRIPVGQAGQVQERRHASGDRDRRGGGADRA